MSVKIFDQQTVKRNEMQYELPLKIVSYEVNLTS